MAVKPIPDGFHTITPYVTLEGAAKAIDFLEKAFGAKEEHKTMRPDGTVWHADVIVGNSHLMISDGNEQFPAAPASFYLYVEDTDATYRSALDAGATSLMAPMTAFYGDRSAGVKDPTGNQWWIATHVEDVSPEEMQRRMANLPKQ
jgi:PhnB protein